ncbi:MAG TPA: hypothetical protein VHB54_20710 [Mucilaginibacter sp.]|nr:hypothetical protein [Mucilaginibacter sp.]HVW16266.1 hypothetical protein [Mucilaginibacter sp.]
MAHLEVKPRSRGSAWLWIIIVIIIIVAIAFIAWKKYGEGKLLPNSRADTTKSVTGPTNSK